MCALVFTSKKDEVVEHALYHPVMFLKIKSNLQNNDYYNNM